MEVERRENETPFEQHKRLIYGKLVDKTLADIDYSELAGPVYGTEWSSDNVRKAMYGSLRTLQLMDSDNYTPPSTDAQRATEIDLKRIELQKERQRFYDQRREFNKLVNEDGRYEHIMRRMAEAAEKIAQDRGPNPFGGHEFDNDRDVGAVLVFSDWHYGMVANNMMNEYDTAIAEQRVKMIVDEAIERIRLHKPASLHVILLGDMCHGGIHTSCRVASNELVVDQLMQVCEIIADAIERLAGEVGAVFVHSTYGNHMRTVQNKNDNLHLDNMERLIPWWLEHRLSNCENVLVSPESDDEFVYIDVNGTYIVASHGDLDNVATSPRLIPAMFMKKYGSGVDCIILGDKHHAEEYEELGVTAMIADALCGADEYANLKRLYSTPGQLMLFVSEGYGVDAVYRLRCNRQS